MSYSKKIIPTQNEFLATPLPVVQRPRPASRRYGAHFRHRSATDTFLSSLVKLIVEIRCSCPFRLRTTLNLAACRTVSLPSCRHHSSRELLSSRSGSTARRPRRHLLAWRAVPTPKRARRVTWIGIYVSHRARKAVVAVNSGGSRALRCMQV